jgi:pimeloyl-ACP methyl ester carboxylesterase
MTTLTLSTSPTNSTIVRSCSIAVTAFAAAATRSYYGLTSRLRPDLARRQAEYLFTTPPRHPTTYPAPAAARRETILSSAGHLAVWQAGQASSPAVLLLHGWGGVGAQLGSFVAPLLARGFRVVWFDHPGHGASERRRVALPDLVDGIAAIDAACGPFHAAIGHSLGAAAAGLALRGGLSLQRFALIGAPASLSDYMHGFARRLGISASVRDAVRRSIESRYSRSFAEIDRIEDLGRLTLPTLLIHDAADRHVPFAHSQRLAACLRGSHLVRTHGLGHFRILRNPSVIRTVTAFISADATQLPREIPFLPTPAPMY